MVGGGGNKIVATLRADCKVYPTTHGASIALANLVNYKIRTEGEISNKSLNTLSVPTTVVDLGKQLLQYARDSDVKGVKNALSRGAPFTSDWLGMSALHFAAMNNQHEICVVLLEGGINKDSKTKVDRTPLHLACYYGNQQIVELLISKNCAVNPRDMLRMTPLHWAIEKRHKSIVRLLLKNNADVTVVTKFGRTPLALAVSTEQADLLGELKSACQSQTSQKYNEQHEKETSEAVNSIMNLTNDKTATTRSKMDVDEEEYINQSEYAAAKIEDLDNIKETGILGSSTINLLKSHGISMMPDDDTSKDMLNTALQNGRQLILSEGGKLLLNETKKVQTNSSTNLNNVNNNNSNSINNPTNTIVPARVRNDNIATYVNVSNNSNVNKLKPNIISKAKDNQQMAKQKNIRIISLNDFKKLYGNTNLKTVQKIPPTVASQQRLVNVRQQTMQPRQMKIDLPSESNRQTLTHESIPMDEEDALSHIIQMATRDSDMEFISEAEIQTQQKQQTLVKVAATQQQQHQHPPPPAMTKQPVRIVPAKRVEHMGTVPVRQVSSGKTLKPPNPSNKQPMGQETKSAGGSTAASVIPLLTTTEICRQLLELRKQNEELRRKFDLAQKEKEEMRQRIERLEEIMLVEKADEDYSN